MSQPGPRRSDEVALFLRDARHSRRRAEEHARELSRYGGTASVWRSPLDAGGSEARSRLAGELVARDAELAAVVDELREQAASLAQACALLEGERSKYVDLFDGAPDAFVTTDLHGVAQDANAAAAALLGVGAGTLGGRPLIGFVARRDTRPFRELLSAMGRAEDDAPRSLTLRMRPRGLPVIFVDARVGLIRGDARAPLALRWVLRRADAANAAVMMHLGQTELARGLARDLRGPLATVAGWARVLKEELLLESSPGEGRAGCAWIAESAEAMQQILEDATELEALCAGPEGGPRHVIDMGEPVRAAIADLVTSLERDRVHVELVQKAAAKVSVDPVRLLRAVGILLARAVDATPYGGVIRVRIGAAQGRADLQVESPGALSTAPAWQVRAVIVARMFEGWGGHLVASDFNPSVRASLPLARARP